MSIEPLFCSSPVSVLLEACQRHIEMHKSQWFTAAGAEPKGQHLLGNSQALACANRRLCTFTISCARLL